MELIKTHKIHPVRVRPGDSIFLNYSYEDPKDVWQSRMIKVDDFNEEATIDTIIVYKTESGEYGLKSGRALIMGTDDGTYKDLPITEGRKPLMGNRLQNDSK